MIPSVCSLAEYKIMQKEYWILHERNIKQINSEIIVGGYNDPGWNLSIQIKEEIMTDSQSMWTMQYQQGTRMRDQEEREVEQVGNRDAGSQK